MLDLHIAAGQGLLIETPSGNVEVWVDDIQPERSITSLDVLLPEDWPEKIAAAEYNLHDEFAITTPDGRIRIKVLRFRPRPDGTGGSVSLGIDAPRSWRISK